MLAVIIIRAVMKRFILLSVILFSVLIGKAQLSIPYTELNYNVHYYWGMIDVSIAHGLLTMQTDGNRFVATLDGNSIPWNGRVYCVSDTLIATMTPGAGLSREHVDYINGWYMKPKVSLYRSGRFNPDLPSNYRNIQGRGTLSANDETMEAIAITADMLGLFYYFREIDFERLEEGQQIVIPVTMQGAPAEKVVITYNGKSHLATHYGFYSTYSVTFEYSYRGRMSGYAANAQVSSDDRIPVSIEASLPIGKVEMTYHP